MGYRKAPENPPLRWAQGKQSFSSKGLRNWWWEVSSVLLPAVYLHASRFCKNNRKLILSSHRPSAKATRPHMLPDQANGQNHDRPVLVAGIRKHRDLEERQHHQSLGSQNKTCIKTLLDIGVSHNTVAQFSGNKSPKSLDSYAVASHDQQRSMSKILSGKTPSISAVISTAPHCVQELTLV